MSQPRYRIYATLLDGFQDYLDCDKNYAKYHADPDSPYCPSYVYYEETKLNELIDRINRVPIQSEAADRGTAFNEVVDCLISDRLSAKCPFYEDKSFGYFVARYKGRDFAFKERICREFANYYQGAQSQVYTSAPLMTQFGEVELYGYIDELMPFSVHDIKTTKHYEAFKFRNHWQHRVYPYCLQYNGNKVQYFEYNVTDFNDTFTERYDCHPETDIPALREHVEWFIRFLESYRDRITDKKIFNEAGNRAGNAVI